MEGESQVPVCGVDRMGEECGGLMITDEITVEVVFDDK